MTVPRKGQAPAKLGRDEFHLIFSRSFLDPAFVATKDALAAVEDIAWNNYSKSHVGASESA